MTRRDVVVIGASAGGIPALVSLLGALPVDLQAALLITVHIPPHTTSRLPEILGRAGSLPVAHAIHGEAIVPGRIYVAPPDYHLLLRDGHIELGRGPRENFCRPAIDPLFRSASRAFGPRVVGIVLSGALYDGSLGLLAVKTRGGIAVVQDPTEATVESMPRNAMKLVDVDHVLSVAGIAEMLTETIGTTAGDKGETHMEDEIDRLDTAMSHTFAEQETNRRQLESIDRLDTAMSHTFAEQETNRRQLESTVFPCPECGGVLWQTDDPLLKFQCHVGHAYAAELLLGHQAEQLEAALWTSLRLLKEKATLSRQLANRAGAGGNGSRMAEQAERDENYARIIHQLLEKLPSALEQIPTTTE